MRAWLTEVLNVLRLVLSSGTSSNKCMVHTPFGATQWLPDITLLTATCATRVVSRAAARAADRAPAACAACATDHTADHTAVTTSGSDDGDALGARLGDPPSPNALPVPFAEYGGVTRGVVKRATRNSLSARACVCARGVGANSERRPKVSARVRLPHAFARARARTLAPTFPRIVAIFHGLTQARGRRAPSATGDGNVG